MAPPTLKQLTLRVLARQLIIAAVLLGLSALATALGADAESARGLGRAKSLAFGAALGLAATAITARSVLKSCRAVFQRPQWGAGVGMAPLYAGLALKLMAVAGGVLFGALHLRLALPYVIIGYLAVHGGYVWAAMRSHH